jgi:hypothetical protein
MKSQDLHIEIRNWILSVIKQRKAIMRMGKSRADAYRMNQDLDYLQRHLDYYPFDDDNKIAGFFQRNQDKIHFLLPGIGSASYESRMEKFRNYLELTKTINENENLSNWAVSKIRRNQTKVPAMGR